MRHPCDTYKNFQPQFAAYEKWTDKEEKQIQAIIEMVSEAGEVLAIVQKAKRKSKSIEREKVLDELGDVLWGLVGVMNTYGFSWSELCDYNIKKLTERNKNK